MREPWQRLLADILNRPLSLLPANVSANASARGAALLAGLASGAYASFEETLAQAPRPEETIYLGEESSAYDVPYARYKELYPRLRG